MPGRGADGVLITGVYGSGKSSVAAEITYLLEQRDTRQQRHTGQSWIARALARDNALRDDLTRTEAADLIYTLMSPEVFRILTIERGWSEQRAPE